MSYLNPLRLHFFGQFQANVSTVNNDPDHFDNAGFQPSYQDMQGPGMNPPNGWFNPQGDAAFRLLGCTVTSAWTASGAVGSSDPVLSCIVADSNDAVPAKLVDLDPEQQLVSEIWGLTVRIADADGNTLVQGFFEPAAFMDIWSRATGSGSDINAGAAYQSVLTGLVWGDVSSSPFLSALQAASADLLSIKFNVDGLSMDFTSPDFMCGRIAGTIGPATSAEPQHLVLGRQFMAIVPPSNGFPVPSGQINFFPAIVDQSGGNVYLDLGNALPTTQPGGPMDGLGDLLLSVYDPLLTPTDPAGSTIPLGTLPQSVYTDAGWYAQTAGIVVLPLPQTPIPWLSSSPLILSGNEGVVIAEASSGAFVRADRFVYRMSPGDTVQIPFYATQWGQPLAGVELSFVLDPSQLQTQASSFLGPAPPVGEPTDALTFSATSTATDGSGIATLSVTASDPGTPRWFNNGQDYGIDGQVYGIRASFADADLNDGPVNQWNFVSFLLWSGFTASNPVVWTDIQPTMQQYANLYPVMNRFLNLGSYDDCKANAGLLQLAFGLNPDDPNAMPVTRDLSPAKRNAILAWLDNPLPGTPQAATEAVDEGPRRVPPPEGPEMAARGGKAAALARRVIVRASEGDRS
ncbi:MAG: hypothetical protein JOZ90_11940 [Alphaproteobacteria bacterium]|nr:hypothetical protein [Alphaproteobacteria bacterium]MBV9371320.1 hypothetical protein [Alphaproteobacteria bacterium]MBV9901784.1 hypothetical protein [Alphaproteobacteria bacterium]